MEELFHQVAAAGRGKLYFLALFGALATPDICAAMESGDGQATGRKYIAWFDKHVGPKYRTDNGGQSLTGADCYMFRNSMLHQGRTQHPRSGYSRILFIEPGATSIVVHNNVMGDALNIDIGVFCEDIAESALAWHETARHSPNYELNYPRFMNRHPKGLGSYIVGVPVIT